MMRNRSIYGRALKMGMVGGGPGAFIGEVHRKAARLDGQIEIVAGAFSRDPAKSRQQGKLMYLDPDRVYGSYTEMIQAEKALPAGERIDLVSIVTPNVSHYPIARDFLKAGFHVVCDKPMTFNAREARQLVELVRRSGKVFGLTHTYTGYPMVKLARDMIRQGDLGTIRKIKVEYPQGWLYAPIERKATIWRTDPSQSGAAGAMGDLGTHAANLSEYVTGLKIVEVCADLTAFGKGRTLDDDGNCLVRWQKGVKGILTASQISAGEENGLAIFVYGDKLGLEWQQENPNYVYVKNHDGPVSTWRHGNSYIAQKSPAAGRASRVPFGHPEGFIEAMANIYVNVGETIRAAEAGDKPDPLALDFPTVEDGLRGMQFIEAVVKSSKLGAKWVKLPS